VTGCCRRPDERTPMIPLSPEFSEWLPVLTALSCLAGFATVLGLRGTGSFSSDDRPKTSRQAMVLLEPNTKAPLTAIMSRLKEEQTDDPEFKVFLKDLPTQRVLGSGSQTSNTTTINIQGSAAGNILKKGHAILNERTLAVKWHSADPTAPFNSFSATRGMGSTPAALNVGASLLFSGSHPV